ncbi:hypothetical protein Ga0609869_000118 [Rhodovulum iodosum]|uniref:EF-hand domain-containing protein n=1 Tax=Rhodovulum iodosum TaxID=68291 RepID=A0ABV3XN72_9RHOB|nr:EF-hand domain-containing protein [Rhodovulum robiginosum]RSK35900.1 EF-hand domain-containing protein [Rhodovulum robiginosum]
MKTFVPTLAATVLLAAGAAFAQTEVADTDGDGVYSMEEIAESYPDLTDDMFAEIDANADGVVDAEELAAAMDAGLLGDA